jgi:c-di-GMP-binding flagellar brake protein YcgR
MNVPTQPSEKSHQPCPGLTLGTTLQLQIQGLGVALSALTGMEEGQYLLIKTPPFAELATKLHEKNHIIVRYVNTGEVFGFRSTLIGIIREPVRFSILSYPATIESINLRKHERANCMVSAGIKLVEGGNYEGIVVDISMGGCSFEFNTPESGDFPLMKIGEEAVLAIHFPGNTEAAVFNICLRSIKMDNKTMRIGIQFLKSNFVETDAISFQAVKTYIAAIK